MMTENTKGKEMTEPEKPDAGLPDDCWDKAVKSLKIQDSH